jgi:pyruvate dehydrogenase kinase 2/3/4
MCALSYQLGKYTASVEEHVTDQRHRLAHRIRDMQTLPYVVVTNPHISKVYELYCEAFEAFRRVKEIQTLEDNEIFCKKIRQTLTEHLTVIPKLAMGVLECRDLMTADDIDGFMNTVLRSVRNLSMFSKEY